MTDGGKMMDTGTLRPARRCTSYAAAAATLALTLALASCSDDIVCPGDTVITAPAITATIVESRLADGERTSVSVRCVADPLPDQLVVFVTGRELQDVGFEPPFSLVATLEDDDIVWQNGQDCSLRVNIDTELATANEPVPGAFAVHAPDDIALGDSLVFRWDPSDEADYYTVRCVIRGARDDSLVLERSVTDTMVSFDPEEVTMAGTASGRVTATAGPFTDGGTDGNISGEGWGFFTVSYYDSLCLFGLTVTDPADR